MYQPGTILRLREPQSTDDTPYAYDLVEVVGQSPVQHATRGDSPWAGQDAIGWIIKPAGDGFAPTIDKPLGQLQELYEIDTWPTDELGEPLTPQNTPQNLPSPEQVFAQQGREHRAEVRKRADSFQHDGKTPEQVLREGAAKSAAAKPRGRQAKESTDGEA